MCGHVTLPPAAQRAADPDLHGLVGGNMTEQRTCADDAVTEEERRRGQQKLAKLRALMQARAAARSPEPLI